MDNGKKIESKATEVAEQDIELVNIEDLRTAFGGEDLAAHPEATQLNSPTVMCGGWN